MGLNIVFTDGEESFGPYPLASASGWTLAGEWAEQKLVHPLVALAHSGEVKNTALLAERIKGALEQHPPDDDAVAHTLTQLLSRIGVGSPDEVARVVD